MRKVEWGDTLFEKFETTRKVNGIDTAVDAANYSAALETYVSEPTEVEELSCLKIGTGEYVVSFYAEKTVYAPMENYYITFYWDYAGLHKCERVAIKIEVDVK